MTRVPSSLLLTAAVAAAGIALAVFSWYQPSQYRFVQRNDAAFSTLPVYPGGHFLKETSAAQHDGGSALSRIVGYTTTRQYTLPTAIPGEAIVEYYLYELRACEVIDKGDSLANFRCRGTVDVTVNVDGPLSAEHYELTVDSR